MLKSERNCSDMTENAHVETISFVWLILGTVLWIAAPIAVSII